MHDPSSVDIPMSQDVKDPQYQQRAGKHLIDTALSWGWNPTHGEGTFEYVTRLTYQRAVEDLVDGHFLARSYKTQYLLSRENKVES